MTGRDDQTLRTLARHAERRRQRLATVSLIDDDPSRAGRLWAVAAEDRPVIAVPVRVLSVQSVIASVAATIDLLPHAIAELHRRGISTTEIRPTVADWDRCWRDAGGDDVAATARAICIESVPDSVLTLPLRDLVDRIGAPAISAVAELIGDAAPAIWIDDLPGRFPDLADMIADIAFAAPAWAIGGAVAASDLEWLRNLAIPSRTQSLLRAGVVSPAPEPTSKPQQMTDDDEPVSDAAHSEAERRLFAALSADPRTAGLFDLNVALDFQFGNRAAEADLYAASLCLVIEIDGWHHFQAAANYRRDRRKDWAYQRHGYRVRRVLAEDVMTELSDVLDRVVQAAQDCRADRNRIEPV